MGSCYGSSLWRRRYCRLLGLRSAGTDQHLGAYQKGSRIAGGLCQFIEQAAHQVTTAVQTPLLT